MDEREKVRALSMVANYGRFNDDEAAKLHDFLVIFHPEMTDEQRATIVHGLPSREDHAASTAGREEA